jgi:DNA-binding MarR family transcriptional regulator
MAPADTTPANSFAPSACPEIVAGRFVDVIGREHVQAMTAAEVGAWTGLIETFETQKRELDADLERDRGLTMSSVGLLGRLAGAEDGRARLSKLANESTLSLSRVSRVIDSLERRGLVEKRPCPSDARATNAHITAAGRTAAAGAQDYMNGWLRANFFDRLTADETESLATVFARLSRVAPGA